MGKNNGLEHFAVRNRQGILRLYRKRREKEPSTPTKRIGKKKPVTEKSATKFSLRELWQQDSYVRIVSRDGQRAQPPNFRSGSGTDITFKTLCMGGKISTLLKKLEEKFQKAHCRSSLEGRLRRVLRDCHRSAKFGNVTYEDWRVEVKS